MENKKDFKLEKIAVLMGGWSAEREISLITGKEVSNALQVKGYKVKAIDLDENIVSNIKNFSPDAVFIALHGRLGEDGAIQGLLEVLRIPYTGSGILASALGINKAAFKKTLQAEGIITPLFFTVRRGDEANIDKELKRIGLPLVVKPINEGSTLGMTIVREDIGFKPALKEAFKYDDLVLVEKFIKGKEITISILGNDNPVALPTIEIVFEREVYDYKAKYTPGLSSHIIPARIDEAVNNRAKIEALKTYKTIGCRGFGRVDLIIDKTGTPYILEINTIPGLTPLSLFPDAAKSAGIEFPDLIEKIVMLALE